MKKGKGKVLLCNDAVKAIVKVKDDFTKEALDVILEHYSQKDFNRVKHNGIYSNYNEYKNAYFWHWHDAPIHE